ncbi:alpha/beta fold hydrolase [Maricaulis sp.]|uniref:alpha/beta fold hydrolase n=1 Tax=Maricaulis sp. TaxID=1486257 RepID=UPI002B27B7B7|nr:alpha/beta fold hydrolase [Maricaulis sp.]
MRFLIVVLLGLALLAGIVVYLLNRPSTGSETPSEGAMADSVDSPWWTDADRLVDVAGVRTRVRIEGPVDAPALIMVHGFSHSLESWDAWAEALSADYRVVRMDLPGHGLTGPDPQARYSVPQTVDFLDGLMDALQIERATLIGNSLGGLVAWRQAATHPTKVDRLVLLSPGGFSINGVTENPVPVPMGVQFYLTQAPQPIITAATGALYGDPAAMAPETPERVLQLMRGDGVGQAMIERLRVFTLPEPTAELGQVEAPTLILWGAADVIIPAAHGAQFVEAMPDARLITYPGLGHVVHEEAPELTLADLRDFLNED